MWYEGSRSWARLAVDLMWVALSAFIALLIRDNFVLYVPKLQGIVPYALLCVVSAAIVFSAARLHRTLWRYISLVDVLRLAGAVTATLLLALLGAFVFNRLEGVARSLPLIQWFLVFAGMVGSRIAVRLWGERKGRKPRQSGEALTQTERVLVVGLSDVTELYLRAVAEFAPASFVIVGVLSSRPELHGRFVRTHEVLGAPEDVRDVLNQLDLHGVTVTRLVVTQPFVHLTRHEREALREIERSSAITVDWLVESLGLQGGRVSGAGDAVKTVSELRETKAPSVMQNEGLPRGRYHALKRVIDATASICIVLALAPVLALAALLVAIDVGFPLVFWQQRPGRYEHPFKLFKFRTMHAAHDVEGNRIPDELRSSSIGRFLRRSWLDELPQLYNILVGEMSFVGPRPLLPIDQPKCRTLRLLVRPGLTGWAQINGGRDIPSEDRGALDIWYIQNASLWLDFRILLRTLDIMILGWGANGKVVQAAHVGVEATKTSVTFERGPTGTH